MRVRVGRNLKSFPLPGAMSLEQRVELDEEGLPASVPPTPQTQIPKVLKAGIL